MAVTHMTPRGSGYTTAVNKAPAYSCGVVGYTGFRGSAALPAYAWEEDPDTGIYSSAANNLDLSTGGAVRANVSSTGLSVTGAISATTTITATTNFAGDVGVTDKEFVILAATLPAIFFTTGTWTNTRNAAGDYVVRKSTAASTSTIEIPLSPILKGNAASKGFQINTIAYVYSINTTALVAHTYDILETTWANNVATAVSTTVGGALTGTLATAAQVNPYVTVITAGTPYYLASNSESFLQISAQTDTTGTYDVIAAIVKGKFTA